MKKRDTAQKATDSEPRQHWKHNHLHFVIVHEEARDERRESSGFLDYEVERIEWRQFRRSFTWDVDRPESGMATFTKKCPHCSQMFKIEVESLNKIDSTKAKSCSRLKAVGGILLAVSVLALVVGFGLAEFAGVAAARAVVPFALLVLLFALAAFGDAGTAPIPYTWRSPSSFSTIMGEARPTREPFSGHYVERVDSW